MCYVDGDFPTKFFGDSFAGKAQIGAYWLTKYALGREREAFLPSKIIVVEDHALTEHLAFARGK
jgi:hypothetical protein